MDGGVVLISGGYEQHLIVWDIKKGRPSHTLAHPDSHVNALKLLPEGRQVLSCGARDVRMYEVEAGSGSGPSTVLKGHAGNVVDLELGPHAAWIVTGSEDGTVKLWDLRARGAQRSWEVRAPVLSLSAHPNGAEVVLGAQDGTLRLLDLVTGRMTALELRPDAHEDVRVRAVAISARGRLAAGDDAGTLLLYDGGPPEDLLAASLVPLFHSGRLPKPTQKQAHSGPLLKLRWSGDGQLLLSAGGDGAARVWSGEGAAIRSLEEQRRGGDGGAPAPWCWDVVWSGDQRYALVAHGDGTLALWDAHQGLLAKRLQGHTHTATCLALRDPPLLGTLPPPAPVPTADTSPPSVKKILVKKVAIPHS